MPTVLGRTDRRRVNGHRSLADRVKAAVSWVLRAGVDRRSLRHPAEERLTSALDDLRAHRDRAHERLSALEVLSGDHEAPGGR